MGEAASPAHSLKPAAGEPRNAEPAATGPQDAKPVAAESQDAKSAAAELLDATSPVDQPPVAVVTPLHQLGDQPQWIDCPFCEHRAMTRLDHRRTPMQFLCGLIIFLGGCVCFSCLPCLGRWFEETNYFCSQCHERVASLPNGGVMIVYGPGGAVPPSKYAKPVSALSG